MQPLTVVWFILLTVYLVKRVDYKMFSTGFHFAKNTCVYIHRKTHDYVNSGSSLTSQLKSP